MYMLSFIMLLTVLLFIKNTSLGDKLRNTTNPLDLLKLKAMIIMCSTVLLRYVIRLMTCKKTIVNYMRELSVIKIAIWRT